MDTTEALFKAVYDDDPGLVKRLVEREPLLARCRNADTLSVLQFARYLGRTEVLEALVAGRARPGLLRGGVARAQRVRRGAARP